jgi:hypothetical protein
MLRLSRALFSDFSDTSRTLRPGHCVSPTLEWISCDDCTGVLPMWQTAHFLTGHGAIHLIPALRSLRRHTTHALLTGFSSPLITQTLLLAVATILFVLACLGLIVVGASYAH